MTANRFNFRFWDKKNNYMFMQSCNNQDFEHIFIEDGEAILANALKHESGYELAVAPKDRYVLMQSTGLVDKNGKEIFEGDFLKDDKTGDILNVQWREDGACFGVSINENWQDYDWRDFGELDMYDLKSLEIIGNEYENPDCWRK